MNEATAENTRREQAGGKRRLPLFGASLTLLVRIASAMLLLAAVLLGYLLASEQGSRSLLQSLVDQTRGQLQIGQIHGTLIDRLTLDGIDINLPAATVTAGHLTLDWQPGHLIAGRLPLREIRLERAVIDLAAPATASDDSVRKDQPISLQDIEIPIDLELLRLQLQDISIRQQGQPLLHIRQAHLSAQVKDGALTLQELALDSDMIALTAAGTSGLSDPFPVELDWQLLRLPDPLREIQGAGRLQGNLQQMRLTQQLQGALAMRLDAHIDEPLRAANWQARLAWQRLQWPPSPDSANSVPLFSSADGQLRADGDLGRFRVDLSGPVSLPQQQLQGRLELKATGTPQQIQLQKARLDTLNGVIETAGTLELATATKADLVLLINHIGPHPLLADWPENAFLGGQAKLSLKPRQAELHADLEVSESPARLQIAASIDPDNLAFQGRIDWQQLSWPLGQPDADVQSTQGQLSLTGQPDDYRYRLDAQLGGSQLPAGHWQLAGSGDREGLRLDDGQIDLLDGRLTPRLQLAWDPQLQWRTEIDASDINPGTHWSEWPGQLALRLHSEGHLEQQGTPSASLRIDGAEGHLRGYPVRLNADLGVQRQQLNIRELALASGVNRLQLGGVLDEKQIRLDWQLDAADLSQLLPELSGKLASRGRADGALRQPALQGTLTGRDLTYRESSLRALDGDVRLALTAGGATDVDLKLTELQHGETEFQKIAVRSQGALEKQQIQLNLQGPELNLDGMISGGYREQTGWQGSIGQLRLNTPQRGEWVLRQPARLYLSASETGLQDFCLVASPDPTIGGCLEGQRAATGDSRFQASLERLPLALLGVKPLTGDLSGQASGLLKANGMLQAEARVNLSPGVIKDIETGTVADIPHQGGSVRLFTDASGSTAETAFSISPQNTFSGRVRLAGLNRLPPSQPIPLDGGLQAQFQDLKLLSSLLPAVQNIQGELAADIALAGQLDRPEISGKLSYLGGALDIPDAGLELRDVALTANTERFGEPIHIQGGLRSGDGQLQLTGSARPEQNALELHLQGERFTLVNLPEYWTLASPDLRIKMQDRDLEILGEIDIPDGLIAPSISINPFPKAGATADQASMDIVRVSPDAVIVDERQGNGGKDLPLRLKSRVKVTIADRMQFRAAGIKARIAGALLLYHRPEKQDPIPFADGELQILEGSVPAFGQTLNIDLGRIMFHHNPVTSPEFDITAVREIYDDRVNEVGMHITGTLQTLSWQVFSKPSMEQQEAMSYLLTGSAPNEAGNTLGFGTQVTPDIYASYGRDIVNGSNSFNLRYDLNRRISVDASVGEGDNNINFSYTIEK